MRIGTIHHVTVTTGHVRQSAASEVAPDSLTYCGMLIDSATEDDVMPELLDGVAIAIDTKGDILRARIMRGSVPIVRMAVAREQSPAEWRRIGTGPEPTAPWCAVAIEGTDRALGWLGDFERCLAWAWVRRPRD